MQLAPKAHLPASGMHGQKKEFPNTNFTKRDTIKFIADTQLAKHAVTGQSMGPDMTCTVCLTRVIAVFCLTFSDYWSNGHSWPQDP